MGALRYGENDANRPIRVLLLTLEVLTPIRMGYASITARNIIRNNPTYRFLVSGDKYLVSSNSAVVPVRKLLPTSFRTRPGMGAFLPAHCRNLVIRELRFGNSYHDTSNLLGNNQSA